jgi:hypothetical protein
MASSSSISSSSSPSLATTPFFSLPKADASKEVWQKYIKDTTERVDGIDPEAAKLVCLGDVHIVKQKEWREGVINHFGSDGDIVLLEGWDAERPMPLMWAKLFVNVSKKVTVYGCDDMTVSKATNAPTKVQVDLMEKYQSSGASWSKEDLAEFNSAGEEIEKYSMDRTYTMIKTARTFLKSLKPGQKIFMIAGSSHLAKGGYKIVNSMHSEKVAVLLPKRPSISDEEALAYSKKLLEG